MFPPRWEIGPLAGSEIHLVRSMMDGDAVQQGRRQE